VSRISKIALSTDLDPDFGSMVPDAVDAYVVSVRCPDRDYYLIAMLPESETEDESTQLLDQVLQLFLEDGDQYTARYLTDNDVDSWVNHNKAPVLGFNPRSLELACIQFFWVIPPKPLMH